MTALPQITTGLARLGAVIRAQAWQNADPLGLTPTQAQILMLLAQRGPARVGEIAEFVAVSQPTASDAVSALVRKGHVEKRPDQVDARATQLRLTDFGREAAGAIETWPDAILGALDVLDDAERGALLRTLNKVIRELQVRRQMPVQRICATCTHFRPHVHDDASAPHHCAFLDVPFGDSGLRIDCGDHALADEKRQSDSWERFAAQ